MSSLWTKEERRAWRWPVQQTPAQWAEQCRILGDDETSEPGPYRFDRTPYWREVLDKLADPTVEEIVCVKGAQVGWSELCRNAIGYWIDRDPAPILVLAPDRMMAQAYRDERLEPLFKHTPAVGRHLGTRAWDATKFRIKLNTCSLFITWAGSKSGAKSRPIGRLICEEPDEYPAFSSTGGDPLSKAEKRLTTYRDKGRAKLLVGGTPTTRSANCWKRWELCGARYWLWVPCPHCGRYQRLEWKRVKWPKIEGSETSSAKAKRLRDNDLAWYECEHCQQRIEDRHKPTMLRGGRWLTEDQTVTEDGRTVGPITRSKRIGFSLSCLYSPWVSFSQLAAEWLESQNDIEALADFINQRLAEPWEQTVAAPREDEFSNKAEAARHMRLPVGVVPSWAGALFLTVDVQQNGMWLVLRAWGHAYRSRLIWYGFVRSFDEVYTRATALYKVEDGRSCRVSLCLIDSGGGTAADARESRTQEVYRFCERAPGLLIPIKGASNEQLRTVRSSPYAKTADGRPVPLFTVHTQRCKDELMRLVRNGDGWELNEGVEPDYLRQMTSEHKVRRADGSMLWIQKGSAENHCWDAEVYQVAAADPDLGRVGLIPPPATAAAAPSQTPAPTTESAEQVIESKETFNPFGTGRRW
jgi:phage terminase large subunit GpA-like protein